MKYKLHALLCTVTIGAYETGVASSKSVSKDEVKSLITGAMQRLRSGDKGAVRFLASVGPAAFDAVARELANPLSEESQLLALKAFVQIPDRRVIEYLASD